MIAAGVQCTLIIGLHFHKIWPEVRFCGFELGPGTQEFVCVPCERNNAVTTHVVAAPLNRDERRHGILIQPDLRMNKQELWMDIFKFTKVKKHLLYVWVCCSFSPNFNFKS